MNLEMLKVTPAALNDPETRAGIEQGVQYIRALLDAHTKGSTDALSKEVNAYQPPRSYELPVFMRDEWENIVACYNAGWDAVRHVPGSTLAKE